jgi:ribosomal protein S18 acetylase RimI-like enzyme
MKSRSEIAISKHKPLSLDFARQAEVAWLDWRCFPGDFSEGWNPQSHVVLARRAGKPVGYVLFKPSDEGSNVAFLSRVGCLPEDRGQGMARKLMAVAFRFAKQAGFRAMVTYCFTNNPASANALLGAGFRICSLPKPLCDGGIHFTKPL